MTISVLFLVFGWGWAIALFGTVVALMRSHDRCYRYAVDQAARFDLMSEAGRAYSDMATVITLDGKL